MAATVLVPTSHIQPVAAVAAAASALNPRLFCVICCVLAVIVSISPRACHIHGCVPVLLLLLVIVLLVVLLLHESPVP